MAELQYAELVEHARLAEQSKRYEDMAQIMKEATTKLGLSSMTGEERNLLSIAYRNVAEAKKSSWRIISDIEAKETDEGKKALQKIYKEKIEAELRVTCSEVLELLDVYLIQHSNDPDKEDKVYYLKMKGDYYRYQAEIAFREDTKRDMIEQAEVAYKDGYQIGEAMLSAANPVRLELAVNFSSFYYEILSDRDEAVRLAKQAFDEAIAEIDTLQEDAYKESTLIVQLLRDNLTLWEKE